MKPVKSNIAESSEACTPISSNCVIWQGPDIPCLSLCSGDSVTEVVYKLATMVCEISDNAFDYTDIDIQCLLDQGGATPTSPEQFYQLIVDKLCEALQTDNTPGGPDTLYNLPLCLQYVDGDGNTIVQVTLVEYVNVIANAVCDIYTTIDSIQTELSSLDARVTALEGLTPSGGSPLINITTQCASGPTPGLILPIQLAFSNLETKFCGLHAVLGTIAQLNATIQTECTDLDTAPTLMDDQVLMENIPGWVVSPVTLAENINNIWLTICDMRAKIIDCCGVPVLTCATITPTNLTVTNVTESGAMVSWYVPAYGTGEPPIEYIVNVFNQSGGNPSGPALLTYTIAHPTTFVQINSGTLTVDKAYIVQVSALYSCGESTVAQVSSVVRISPAAMCLQVYESGITSSTILCNGTSYPVLNKRTYARLQNTVGGTPVTNTGLAISVVVRYTTTNECGVTSNTTMTIVIPNGSYEGYVEYASLTKAVCGGSGSCGDVTKALTCVQSISGTAVTLCATGAAMCPGT